MNERYLSPTARRRREIVAEVELAVAAVIGAAWGVVATLGTLMALGVL